MEIGGRIIPDELHAGGLGSIGNLQNTARGGAAVGKARVRTVSNRAQRQAVGRSEAHKSGVEMASAGNCQLSIRASERHAVVGKYCSAGGTPYQQRGIASSGDREVHDRAAG